MPLRRLFGAVRREESGFTLIEIAIVMLILSLVMAIFIPTLYAVQQGFETQSDRSQNNDNARLAVEELDREIRSGNVLYDPSDPTCAPNPGCNVPQGIMPYMTLLIYTQTNANQRNPGFQCVQWRILNGQLQRRAWATTWRNDGNVSPWRIIAEHVVNQPNPPTPPTTPPFSLDQDPNKGGRTVIVTIQVNQNASTGRTVTLTDSITGRNTEYGYPNNVCTDIPPY
jgi:prepilin-type N-terminal cleavage/methylation domain-containing protein